MTQLPPKGNQKDDPSRLQPSNAKLQGLAKPADISRPASTGPQIIDTSKPSADTLSDKATAAFIRRTLCAHHALSGAGEKGRRTPKPVDELLPPLTSSNEVDLQLYAILAVILKEFVYTWYAKITPDHVFVDQVLQIIAHCTRALEQRLRKVDLETLLLDEIPQLINAHLKAFHIANESIYPYPLASSPREIYHILNPHPALSPVPRDDDPSSVLEQQLNEEAWRQLLVQGVLAVLLPTEDVENACLRALVAEIFSEMILGNVVSQKACEPWLLWDAITTIIQATQPGTMTPDKDPESKHSPTTAAGRLEQFGLLSADSQDDGADRFNLNRRRSNAASAASGLFWVVVQYIFLASRAAWIVIHAVATSSSLPSRSKTWLLVASPTSADRQDGTSSKSPSEVSSTSPLDEQRPILDMGIWSTISKLIELKERMPWLSGLLDLAHYGAVLGPFRVGDTDGAIDRLLSNLVHKHILNPTYLPKVLRLARATLFPNNAPGPSRRIPTAPEIIEIKRKCAVTIADVIPPALGAKYFQLSGDGNERREGLVEEVERLLGVLGDAYFNRHLIFGILSLVVLRLIPEMEFKGVGELMRERVGEEKD